jgi:glycosyltransferase involved in cell wall biosynthesis
MRICVVYDCLYPYTIGGAERWYRDLAQSLVEQGHEVTYLTRLQWAPGKDPDIEGVRVVAVTGERELYDDAGRRRIDEAILFGLGVFRHLLRHGRSYDAVHMGSFPYFSLLAAGVVRPLAGYRLAVDWHELWAPAYWHDYVGPVKGRLGLLVQRLCLRPRQHAFCFSQLVERRLADGGVNGPLVRLTGQYAGGAAGLSSPAEPTVFYAGRQLPEKRVLSLVPALAAARERVPGLRARLFGDGPDHAALVQAIEEHGLVGLVEAAAAGVPSIVVAGDENAAVELVEEGINGFVAASAEPQELARTIEAVHEAGSALRDSTRRWYAANAERLSLASSLRRATELYR